MTVARITEISSISTKSFEDAIVQGVDRANKTLKNVKGAWIKEGHQARRRICHAPGAARRAKTAPLAAERDELVVAAVAAAQSQEAVRQDAALEERVGKKGRSVYVKGRLKTRKYTDKDGVEKYCTEILATEMQLLGGRDGGGSGGDDDNSSPAPARSAVPARGAPAASKPSTSPTQSSFDDMDDDIPF